MPDKDKPVTTSNLPDLSPTASTQSTRPIQHFDMSNISFMDKAPTYQKRQLTHAKLIDGPFSVKTSEGELTCEDGYLAVDSRGEPYPIAREVFEATYERVG